MSRLFSGFAVVAFIGAVLLAAIGGSDAAPFGPAIDLAFSREVVSEVVVEKKSAVAEVVAEKKSSDTIPAHCATQIAAVNYWEAIVDAADIELLSAQEALVDCLIEHCCCACECLTEIADVSYWEAILDAAEIELCDAYADLEACLAEHCVGSSMDKVSVAKISLRGFGCDDADALRDMTLLGDEIRVFLARQALASAEKVLSESRKKLLDVCDN